VVFLTTDDHMFRVTKIRYQPNRIGQPERWDELPGVFQVLSGPMGAGRPDLYDNPTIAELEQIAAEHNADLQRLGQAQLGLAGYPGLHDVYRAGRAAAATTPASVDFFSPDTFGYTTLTFESSGILSVEYWGVPSYQPNTYPTNSPRAALISRFSISPRR